MKREGIVSQPRAGITTPPGVTSTGSTEDFILGDMSTSARFYQVEQPESADT